MGSMPHCSAIQIQGAAKIKNTLHCERSVSVLASNDSHTEVQSLHCITEGGADQACTGQTTSDDDDWSAAILVHQDAADWSCLERKAWLNAEQKAM